MLHSDLLPFIATTMTSQELVEKIIDHLSGDSRSLKACALVCNAWLSRTRFHLFKTCTLGQKHSFLPGPDAFSRWMLLLPTRSITASRYDWAYNDRYFTEIAQDLHGQLVNIQSLMLTLNIIVPHLKSDFFFDPGFITGFPYITELILTCSFDRFTAPLLSLLPALQRLSVRELTEIVLAEPTARAVSPLALRSLSPSPYCVAPVTASFQRGIPFPLPSSIGTRQQSVLHCSSLGSPCAVSS
ncbi:hypothetical protein DFH07DRAFT_827856 [Mycena maculata]|uniref:F-box domain-containing protein n=1 Tax=Mycena maculata TaxID=230809 RepID=A0AAD7N9L8_9AGAR|nr:hypothetical protein DFH07DRAFT_827856 [Mycena maculata]